MWGKILTILITMSVLYTSTCLFKSAIRLINCFNYQIMANTQTPRLTTYQGGGGRGLNCRTEFLPIYITIQVTAIKSGFQMINCPYTIKPWPTHQCQHPKHILGWSRLESLSCATEISAAQNFSRCASRRAKFEKLLQARKILA